MKIETKYNKHDRVFAIHQSGIHAGKVSRINISVNGNTDIKYQVIFETVDLGSGEYGESLLFESRETLKASL